MSTLFVNNLNTASGTDITVAAGKTIKAPGSVVQFAYRDPTATMQSQVTTNTASYANTNISVTITPKYANSIILIVGDFHIGSAGGYSDYVYGQLRRVISGGATTSLGHVHSDGRDFGCFQAYYGSNQWRSSTFTFPDTPNTTSAITYQVWTRNNSTSGNHYVGWTSSSNNTFTHNGIFLNAIEIAQ